MDPSQTYSFYYEMLSNLKLILQITDPMIEQIEEILSNLDPTSNKENIKPQIENSFPEPKSSARPKPKGRIPLSQTNTMKIAHGQATPLSNTTLRFGKASSKNRNINNVTPFFNEHAPPLQEKIFSQAYNMPSQPAEIYSKPYFV